MNAIATLAGLLLLAHGGAADADRLAQPDSAATPAGHARDRSRTVRGWLVEDMAEDDGGRVVRMTRTSGSWRLEYYAAFWHGNDGIIRVVTAIGGECGNVEQLDRHRTPTAAELRTLLTGTLTECGAPPAAVRAALHGLEPAYARADAWSAEAAEATAAEAARIADYGKSGDD